jgi:Kef-type K+ transport system membrane component KefB
MGVADPRRRTSFVLEPAERNVVSQEFGAKHLEGDDAAVRLANRPVDDARTAAPDDVLNAIDADRLAGAKLVRRPIRADHPLLAYPAMTTPPTLNGRRTVVIGYVVLLVAVIAAFGFAIAAGSRTSSPPPLAGEYELEGDDPCLGPAGSSVHIGQSGRYVTIGGVAPSRLAIDAHLEGDALRGSGTCADGQPGSPEWAVVRAGTGANVATAIGPLRAVEAPDEAEALIAHPLPPEQLFARLMLAMAAVMLAARLVGSLVTRIGQPRVMGEVLAGILLGPTLLGTIAPAITGFLFPTQVIPLIGAAANIGLAFYMFLVGLELDPRALRGRVSQAAFISNVSVAVPMALGVLVAVPLHGVLGPPDVPFLPFALFMGVSMSITAFPVLARILIERRMIRQPVGALAIAAAAVDDVTAWALLAVATGVATAARMTGTAVDPALELGRVLGLTIAFCVFMAVGVRRILGRIAAAYDEAGHVSTGWIALIFLGILLATAATGLIGVAPIFGAFVMGLVMPRREGLSHDVTRRIEDFIVIVLLPLFFAVAGLRTNVGLLRDPELVLITVALTGVAVVAKFASASGAARLTGMDSRESLAVGALMNTRGLTELIVLTLGLELGVITPALFTMLVIMALVTTFMTGPLLRLIDPRGILATSAVSEIRVAAPVLSDDRGAAPPSRAILVAALDEQNTEALLAVARPLALTEPKRAIIAVRLLEPGPLVAGVSMLDRRLADAQERLIAQQASAAEAGVTLRVAALTSADPARDLLQLGGGSEIDLVIVDGRRPVIGGGILGGPVAAVLAGAPSDVAVLVRRGSGSVEAMDGGMAVVVPFGGAEHDWAALELGAWIASATARPLRLVGAAARADGAPGDASRLLASASVVVQQVVGVVATTTVIQPTPSGIAEAARDANILVVGLSDRWREEGLGRSRSELAAQAEAPILFVRRGSRPGILAPRDDLTKFTWSAGAADPAAVERGSPSGGEAMDPGAPRTPSEETESPKPR